MTVRRILHNLTVKRIFSSFVNKLILVNIRLSISIRIIITLRLCTFGISNISRPIVKFTEGPESYEGSKKESHAFSRILPAMEVVILVFAGCISHMDLSDVGTKGS